MLWGVLLLIALGIGWIALRARAALPVVAMWRACVVLYVMAASSTVSWTALITGYWYNDKVRLASLAAVPGVVLVAAAAPALRALLRKMPALRSRPVAVGLVALLVIPLTTVGAQRRDPAPDADRLLPAERPEEGHPVVRGPGLAAPARTPSSRPARASSDGPRTARRNVAAVRHQHPLPLDPHPHDRRRDRHRHRLRRHGEPTGRLRRHGRHDIRWAVDSTHVYWLDRPERSSGLKNLADVDGVEPVRTDGDYTLYRVTGCGLGSAATPAGHPRGHPAAPCAAVTPGMIRASPRGRPVTLWALARWWGWRPTQTP